MPSALLVAQLCGCAPAAGPPHGASPDVDVLFSTGTAQSGATAPVQQTSSLATAAVSAAPVAPAPQAPCTTDDDCGYDAASGRCGTDPRYNKQPPLVDQGLVCYCEEAMSACALLRVEPAPCEGEAACAVRLDPRPHPVRASAEHRYRKPRYCRSPRGAERRVIDRYTTCERTNICTMHTRECAQP